MLHQLLIRSMEQSKHGLKYQHMEKKEYSGSCFIISPISELMVVALSMAMGENGGRTLAKPMKTL